MMIYTCTLNPAIDYKIQTDSLSMGVLNRFHQGQFRAGGKGINVAIVLKKLGMDSIATGFLGGFTGAFIERELTQTYGLKHDFVHVSQDTRLNVKIADKDAETELNHDGNEVTGDERDQLIRKIGRLSREDMLICGGSTAKGHPDLYREMAELCHQKSILFVMDTPGNYLSQFIAFKPFLIKPNIHELEAYFDKKMHGMEDIVEYGKKLHHQGAEHVLISMGSEGSILIDKDKVYRASVISDHIKSTVGAGDSMVAGFVSGYIMTHDIIEAYRWSVAAASATAFGDELADPRLYHTLLKKIDIQEMKAHQAMDPEPNQKGEKT